MGDGTTEIVDDPAIDSMEIACATLAKHGDGA